MGGGGLDAGDSIIELTAKESDCISAWFFQKRNSLTENFKGSGWLAVGEGGGGAVGSELGS